MVNRAPDADSPPSCDAAACATCSGTGRPPFSLRAWLEVARVSNLPTIVTNTLTGVALAGVGPLERWPETATLAAVLMLFHIGGMALNDALDAPRDAVERPGRPIPSGRVRRCDVKKLAAVTLTLGTGLTAAFGARAFALGLALLGAILAYNWLHARWRAAALLMGLCRGLVYLLAAAAFAPHIDARLLIFAAALALYILLLTIVAADEAARDHTPASRWAAIGLPLAALLPLAAGWPWPGGDGLSGAPIAEKIAFWVSGALLAAWLGRALWLALAAPGRTISFVLAALAGICLFDAWLLALLQRPAEAAVALACFGVTLALQPRIAAT